MDTGHPEKTRAADPTKQQLLDESPTDSECQSSRSDRDVPGAAPDGGWGWVVVFAVFMSSFLVDGSIGSFGIIYPELLQAFGAGPSMTSLAGSIIVAVFLMSCPLAGFLLRRFGCRLVCIVGGCVTAVGFVIASMSANVFIFILCYGVLGGVGIGMNLLAGNILVNMYFDKRRGLACGIVSSGAGFGVFVMALATQELLNEYGWRGTMLVTGGIMLHFCVFACFLRPLTLTPLKRFGRNSNSSDSSQFDKLQMDVSQCEESEAVETDVNIIKNSDASHINSGNPSDVKAAKYITPNGFQSLMNISHVIKPLNKHLVSLPDLSGADTSAVNVKYRNFSKTHDILPSHHYSNDPFLRKDIYYSGSLNHLREYRERTNMKTFISSMAVINSEDETSSTEECSSSPTSPKSQGFCDLSVFKNGVYIPILTGAILLQMGQFIPSTFIPEYCVKIGLPGSDGSVLISIYGAVNILGRLSAGCLANLRCVNSLWLCNFGAAMCALCCALFPLCTTFPTLCVFAVAFGYFIGYSCPLQYIILVEYLGVNKLTSAMGILCMCKGPAALVGPPLAGFVYMWTQDYAMTVEFAGALFLLAAAVQSLVPLTNRCCAIKADRMEIRVDI